MDESHDRRDEIPEGIVNPGPGRKLREHTFRHRNRSFDLMVPSSLMPCFCHDLFCTISEGLFTALEILMATNTDLDEQLSSLRSPLVQWASSSIGERFASRLDAEDVLQSVYRTFYRRYRDGQFRVENIEDMKRLLIAITRRKLVNLFEHHTAGIRDVRRERFSAGDLLYDRSANSTRQCSPEHSEEDLRQHILRNQPEEDRQILAAAMDGHSPDEIATIAQCSRRTVFRALDRVRSRVREMMARDPDLFS